MPVNNRILSTPAFTCSVVLFCSTARADGKQEQPGRYRVIFRFTSR